VYDHPLSISLRKNYQTIIDEYFQLSEKFLGIKPNNLMGIQINQDESNGEELYTGRINSVFTRVAAETCSESELNAVWGSTIESKLAANNRFAQKQLLTPTLEKIIEPYLNNIGCVGFNLMYPSTKLSMHYGMISKYARFHLGLICDPEAKFHVKGYPPRAWEPGKVWCFDDGDAFHGTVHNGTVPRLILIVDLDRSAIKNIESEKLWG
jgi:hypothetical protein